MDRSFRPADLAMGQALAANRETEATTDARIALRRAIPDHALESVWRAADGYPIRRIDWPGRVRAGHERRGALLFVPGRADFYEKYIETLDRWHDQGWRVTALDWRWQAGSGRYYPDPQIGGVDDFSTWVNDVTYFWQSWTASGPGPHVLIGHSMGGHLALRAVAERKVRPDALVLSAPMLGFVTPIPRWLQPAVARTMCRIGDGMRPVWSAAERPRGSAKRRGAALTHDPGRYADEAWWRRHRPELDLGPASWDWVRRASQSIDRVARSGMLDMVDVPVQVVATRCDRVVSWQAIRRAAGRLPRVETLEFGCEAAHELLREVDPVRDRVLCAIDQFLARHAP